MKSGVLQEDGSLLAIDQYLRGVRQVKGLTQEEEGRLVSRLAQGNREKKKPCLDQGILRLAEEARVRLAEKYQVVLAVTAKKYIARCRGMEFLDLIQEGNVGLMSVLDAFEQGNAQQLHALVVLRVDGAMRNALRDHNGVVRMAAWVYELRMKRYRVEHDLSLRLGRVPMLAEVAREMGVSEEKLQEVVLLGQRAEQVQSLQALEHDQDEEEVSSDRFDFQSLYEAPSVSSGEQERLLDGIRQAVKMLPARQREVLTLRYGLDGVCFPSPRELGRHLGIESGAVCGSERRAVHNLRKLLSSDFLMVSH